MAVNMDDYVKKQLLNECLEIVRKEFKGDIKKLGARIVALEKDKEEKDGRLKTLEGENQKMKKDIKELKRRNTVLEKKSKQSDKVPGAAGSDGQSPVQSPAQSPAQIQPVASPVVSPANPQGPAQGQGQSPRRSPRSPQTPSRLNYDSSHSSGQRRKKKSPSKKFWNDYKKLIAKGEKISAKCIKTGKKLRDETGKAKRYYNAKVRRALSSSSSTGSSSSHPSTSGGQAPRSPTSPRQSPARRTSPASPRQFPAGRTSPASPRQSSAARRTPPKDPARRKKRYSTNSFQNFSFQTSPPAQESSPQPSSTSSFQNFSSNGNSPIFDAASAQNSPAQASIASPVRRSFSMPGAARAVPVTAPRWSSIRRRLSFNLSDTDATVALDSSDLLVPDRPQSA